MERAEGWGGAAWVVRGGAACTLVGHFRPREKPPWARGCACLDSSIESKAFVDQEDVIVDGFGNADDVAHDVHLCALLLDGVGTCSPMRRRSPRVAGGQKSGILSQPQPQRCNTRGAACPLSLEGRPPALPPLPPTTNSMSTPHMSSRLTISLQATWERAVLGQGEELLRRCWPAGKGGRPVTRRRRRAMMSGT